MKLFSEFQASLLLSLEYEPVLTAVLVLVIQTKTTNLRSPGPLASSHATSISHLPWHFHFCNSGHRVCSPFPCLAILFSTGRGERSAFVLLLTYFTQHNVLCSSHITANRMTTLFLMATECHRDHSFSHIASGLFPCLVDCTKCCNECRCT